MLGSINRRDLIAGLVLLAAALVWILLVYQTIEPNQGPETGARGFPLFLGIALAVLAAFLTVRGLRNAPDDGTDDVPPATLGAEVWFVGAATVLTLIFGFLIEKLGFIVSSALFVAAVATILLRIRRPLVVAAMALGLSLGAYLVFGKLLGTYLPPGTWISIQF